MIIKEFFLKRNDGVKLYRTYSDKELKIRKAYTDEIYDEAIDVETNNSEYIETDIPIEKLETKEETNENQGEE